MGLLSKEMLIMIRKLGIPSPEESEASACPTIPLLDQTE
jgi:hypothetical protein